MEVLYHGSTELIPQPRIIISDKKLDFGCGFYTTRNQQQAKEWAEQKTTTKAPIPYVSAFLYKPDETLKIKTFTEPNLEWAQFILEHKYLKHKHEYDVVQGACVTNKTAALIKLNAEIKTIENPEQVVESAKKHCTKLHQITFCTDNAIKTLTFLPNKSGEVKHIFTRKHYTATYDRQTLELIEIILQNFIDKAIGYMIIKYQTSKETFLSWLYKTEFYQRLTNTPLELWAAPDEDLLSYMEYEYVTGTYVE